MMIIYSSTKRALSFTYNALQNIEEKNIFLLKMENTNLFHNLRHKHTIEYNQAMKAVEGGGTSSW